MSTQRYEIEAWLGDDHGLTEEQIGELAAVSDDIAARYPDQDYADEREAAMTAAYRAMRESSDVIDDLARDLLAARIAQARALAGLRQAALSLIPAQETQAGFARRAGVDRMAVRGWLGQR